MVSAKKATQADVTAAEAEIIRRRGLEYFVQKAWHLVEPGTEYRDNWHVGAVCEVLDDVRKGDRRNVVINIPPGCMKSLLVEVFWPVDLWIHDPGQRVTSVSYDSTLTLRDAKKSLGLMQSEWFRARFPKVRIAEGVAAGDYPNDAGGWRFSTSIGGKLTGRHCDKMVLDDPLKPQTLSKTTLEEAERWWRETRPTRFRDLSTAATVVIMQRLHDLDPAAIAERDGFELVRIPMRYEPKAAWIRDPRKEDGELLWPARFPEAAVAELEKTMGSRVAAAQLQQRPVPEGGLIFQSDWFKHWSPAVTTVASSPAKGLPARFDVLVQSWDCTFKDTETSDYVVGQVWGRRGAEFYLLDQRRDRMSFGATCDAIRAMTRKWPAAITKLVEDKANGSAVISTLKKDIPGLIPINPEGGKVARANAVAPLFEAGNVFHPDPAVYPWVDEHRDELTSFPFGANDDSVDACTQALLWLYGRKSNLPAAMDALKLAGGMGGFFSR